MRLRGQRQGRRTPPVRRAIRASDVVDRPLDHLETEPGVDRGGVGVGRLVDIESRDIHARIGSRLHRPHHEMRSETTPRRWARCAPTRAMYTRRGPSARVSFRSIPRQGKTTPRRRRSSPMNDRLGRKLSGVAVGGCPCLLVGSACFPSGQRMTLLLTERTSGIHVSRPVLNPDLIRKRRSSGKSCEWAAHHGKRAEPRRILASSISQRSEVRCFSTPCE